MQGSRHPAAGNALFLILIAVALFAALSYAVTQSGRGGGSAAREQEMLEAAQMVQYAGQMRAAVQRLQLVNGCTDAQISFKNSTDTNYNNTNAPADGRCGVFDPSGGGMSYRSFLGQDPFITLSVFKGMGKSATPDANAPENFDIAFYVPVVSLALCQRINAALGLPAALAMDQISFLNNRNTYKFKGLFTGTFYNVVPDNGGNMAGYTGVREGCLQSEANATYYPYGAGINYFFFAVLLER